MKLIKKFVLIMLAIGIINASACADTKVSGTDKNTTEAVEDKTEGLENKPAVMEDGKRDISLFEYTLEEGDIVLITKYIGEEENVTVYDSYEIDGKEYKTVLHGSTDTGWKESVFRQNQIIKSVRFEGTVKIDYCAYLFEYCDNLEAVDLSGLDTSESTSFAGMFYQCSSLQEIDLSVIDTSKATDMSNMFYNCAILKEIDFSVVDTSNVTDFRELFDSCRELQKVNLEGVDTSKAEDMHGMFMSTALETIDVSGFDTTNVCDMSAMFAFSNIKSLDLSNFNTSNVTLMNQMFDRCSKLTEIDMSSFDTSQVTDMSKMFYAVNMEQIDISNFDAASLKSIINMFGHCDELIAVYANQDWCAKVMSEEVKHDRVFDKSSISEFTIK